MPANVKNRLLDRLSEAHHAVEATLDNVHLETPVHNDTGWRVRDILGHIATWDREAARSLRAYRAGSEYIIPDFDEDEYNHRAVSEQRKLSVGQILEEFEGAYNELRTAIQEMPDDRFPGDLLYPWGDERGDIATLVEYMIEHADEHNDEIKQAAQEAEKD
jgi:hypothetical protein